MTYFDRPTRRTSRFFLLVLLVTLSTYVLSAQAVDLMPEDAVAPPDGLHAVQIRGVAIDYRGSYVSGEEIDSDAHLRARGVAVRYALSKQLFGRPSVLYIDLPGGEVTSRLQGTLNAGQSVGDISLAFAHWLVSDQKNQEYAGVVGYLILPTGDYDPRYTAGYVNTNLGQNRWLFALQGGYSKSLLHKVTWLVAADTVWFGDNRDFRPEGKPVSLEQKPLYSIQNHVSYRPASSWMVGVGHIWTTRGAWVVDGVALDNGQDTHRIQLASTYDLPGNFRLGLQLGRSLRTENGLRERRELNLRLWRYFY